MKKRLLALLLTAAMLLALAACGSSSSDTTAEETAEETEEAAEETAEETAETEESEAAEETAEAEEAEEEVAEEDADDTEYPIVIEHAYGTTVIESKPERIVTLAWGNQDTVLALGVVPVGVSAANYGYVTDNMLHVWTEEAFIELGEENPNVFNDVDGWDYEAISDAQPDVILCAYSGMSEEEYQLLSEIAPVVPFAEVAWKTTWRDQTIENATGMGMKEEGEALVAEVDALIEEKLAEYPELEGKTAAFFWVSADDMSTFYAYLTADPRASYLLDLGLELPDSIAALDDGTGQFSVAISRENAEQFSDVDIMIVYGDEALLEAMQADPLMSTIPAVANGAVVLLDSESNLAAATTPSILSIPYMIDEYLEELSEAASKVQ